MTDHEGSAIFGCKEAVHFRETYSEATKMNVFFAELNTLVVSIIGVLLVVVVPEIMLNVMSRTEKRNAIRSQG